MDGESLCAAEAGPGRAALTALLLLADESPAQVARSIDDGDLYALEDAAGVPLGITLVPHHGDGTAELKAISVRPDRQGQGVGRRMLQQVLDGLRRNGTRRVLVATGASSLSPLALYLKLGFRPFRIDRDFFAPKRGYPEEIAENGIHLRDLVWLDLEF